MSSDKTPHPNSGPESEISVKLLQQIMAYQDGALSGEELQRFEEELKADPANLKLFAEIQIQSAAIHNHIRHQVYVEGTQVSRQPAATGRFMRIALPATVVATCLMMLVTLGIVLYSVGPVNERILESTPVAAPAATAPEVTVPAVEPPAEKPVLLAGASRAKFFGELNPKEQSALLRERQYVLTEGLIELAFPTGATAIIEAPAIFRVLTEECLAMDSGKCSVHAPDGAEGFRLETPVTRVIDRGTRFTVSVVEGVETEVQVIEGAADVYWKSEAELPEAQQQVTQDAVQQETHPLQVRLIEADAQRFSGADVAAVVPVKFAPESYRGRLPDRIISFEATTNAQGGAENLQSVTVKRGGVRKTYPVDDLILPDLIWFKSDPGTDPSGHLAGGPVMPDPGDLLADTSLLTGVINPGGNAVPLTADPVMKDVDDPESQSTPGLGIRFRRPVVNGPGPDIVLFELQSYSNPPDGDAFHVSPVHFLPHLRSRTIKTYDLTLLSPESLSLGVFYLYQYPTAVGSLSQLQTVPCERTRLRFGFRAVAVGIDLSDLGFRKNESVSELFIQDAHDDEKSRVDPVFIGGFPAD